MSRIMGDRAFLGNGSCRPGYLGPTVWVVWLLFFFMAEPMTAAAGTHAEYQTREDPSTSSHWAYQPVIRPAFPKVKQPDWVRSPVDPFILARLEEEGLSPSQGAQRRVLIRRLTYDLTGLPPTFAEVNAFLQDTSPIAWEKLVDRLLASPRFGERWGRHWLDVARYSETKDLVLQFGTDRLRPYAYTYRDYVIRAFNEDLPMDEFITDQLAADQTASADQPWRLAAMGFLTLGRLFDNNPHDIYDDQIDVVTRGLLGLTVSCARCHDHKYDAITLEDYYALYGVFANSESPLDLPLIENPSGVPGGEAFETRLAAKRKELQDHIDAQFKEITETARRRTGDYLVELVTKPASLSETAVFYLSLSPEDLRPGLLGRWRAYLEQQVDPSHAVFGPWREIFNQPDGSWVENAAMIQKRWKHVPPGTESGQLNPLIGDMLASLTITNRAVLASGYGAVFASVWELSQKGELEFGSPETVAARKQLLTILTGHDGPISFPRNQTYLYMSRVPRDTYGALTKGLDTMAAESKISPPARAMVLHDADELRQTRALLRGNPNTPGPKVERRFLSVLGGEGHPFTQGSGRLELARAIVSPENPLTRRVLVNRVWMHLLGEPLISSPSDLGIRTPPPSHPALLDYLAWSLQENGWSLKHLIRSIVVSKTYRQSSHIRPELGELDPDNRLLACAHKKRLDFESMRDTMLFLSGRLDLTLGGRPVDVAGDPDNRRRTVYGLVDRQDLPQLYRVFDFASPDQSSARRPETIVPQQALFGLNSPFVLAQARALVSLVEQDESTSVQGRVTLLYQSVLARNPTAYELDRGVRFIEAFTKEESVKDHLTPWQQYAQALLLTNELLFLD